MKRERGSAALELVLVTPVLVALLLFVVLVGRLAAARSDVDRAARDAARAASLARSPAEAVAAAQAASSAAVGESLPCAALEVNVDTSNFEPGGTVTTAVTCTVALSDLAGLAVPGARTLQSDFREPVDRYRAVRQ